MNIKIQCACPLFKQWRTQHQPVEVEVEVDEEDFAEVLGAEDVVAVGAVAVEGVVAGAIRKETRNGCPSPSWADLSRT